MYVLLVCTDKSEADLFIFYQLTSCLKIKTIEIIIMVHVCSSVYAEIGVSGFMQPNSCLENI